MKGVLKGVLFSFLMTLFLLSATALAEMFFDVPDTAVKAVSWISCALSVFFGAMLVSKGAESRKAVKGICSAAISLAVFFICLAAANTSAPVSGSFYTLMLVSLICGAIGAFAGTK